MRPSGWIMVLRGLLGAALLVGGCLIAVAMLAGAVVMEVRYVLDFLQTRVFPLGPFVVQAAIASAASAGLYAAGRQSKEPSGAVEVSPDEEPELWDTVLLLADQLRVRPPMRMFLVHQANAGVQERSALLGLVGGPRSLCVGLPLLVGLTHEQLKAVLCHELSHYAGRHTAVTSVNRRGTDILDTLLDRLGNSPYYHPNRLNVVWQWHWFVSSYARLHAWLTSAVRRLQEFEADRMASDSVGAANMADALLASHAVQRAWAEFVSMYLEPVARFGHLPDNAFEVFGAMVSDPSYQQVLQEWRSNPPDQPASRDDSHPPLADRIAALTGHSQRGPQDVDRTRALDLLSDPVEPAAVLTRTLLRRQASAENATWLSPADWTATAAATLAGETAESLARAAGRLTRTTRPTMRTVLDAVATAPEVLGRSDLLPAALSALVGKALVSKGVASGWRLSWIGPSEPVADEDLLSRLRDATNAGTPAELLSFLSELDIDLATPVRTMRHSSPPSPDSIEPLELPPELADSTEEDDLTLHPMRHPVLRTFAVLLLLSVPIIILASP